MEERRRFKRIPLDAILIYQIQNYPEDYEGNLQKISAPTNIDISMGGLKLLIKQKLPKGTFLKINLSLSKSNTPIEVIGKIAWINKAERRDRYQAGIKFIDFDDEDHKEVIRNYIYKDAK